jgi:hypothetical protein
MPLLSPTDSDLHVDKMLTNISLGYTNLEYIADQIFPIVLVDKQTDIIPEYNKDFWFRDDAGLIAEGDVAPEVGYKVTKTQTFYCHRYGVRHFISDDRRVNEDAPFNSDRDATLLVTEKLLQRRERAFAADFFATSKWTTDKTGTTHFVKWSDFGSSDPISDIRTWKRTVRRLIGRDPNALVLGDLVFDVLMDHPDVLDRIKYTERGIASEELLRALFGLDKLIVGKSLYGTTAEGAATQTLASNWDDDALLLYVPASPSLFTPAAGYTFVWRTGSNAGGQMQWMRKYRSEERLGDYIEVRSNYDQYQTVGDAGLFLSDAVDDPTNV